MKRLVSLLAATALASAGMASTASAVTTNVYSGVSSTASGAPYSGLVGTLFTSGITFATDTSFNWHPFGLGSYGTDSFATIDVASAGTYTFSLNSDDGSQAFIDGSLVVDDGFAHGPTVVSNSVSLTAGTHALEVQFFECCGGDAGVDFSLPSGVTYQAVPEPASWALMLVGFGALGGAMRSRRKLAFTA